MAPHDDQPRRHSPDTIDVHTIGADAARVRLDDELLALTEILARHVHDTWVRVRRAEGWTHGPHRNDDRKEHPCLIPYDDLPEHEKDCDRQTTLATLKALVALGFEIRRRDTSSPLASP